MVEEKLICLVQKYKEIYDLSNKDYHNQQVKDNIWEEIGGEIKRPVSECKKRWGTLRDSFRRSMKCKETRSGQSAANKKSWRYDKQMSFLEPFLADRKQISNVDKSDSSETEAQEQDINIEEDAQTVNMTSPLSIASCSSTSTACNATPNKPQMLAKKKYNIHQKKNATLSSAEVLQNYLNDKRRRPTSEIPHTSDPINKFFECMAETVKTFSPQLQIEVKSKIFSIVSDAERTNMNFSSMPGEGTAFATHRFPFASFHHQNQGTMPLPPQPQFQQEPYQLPYSRPQTQHSTTTRSYMSYSEPQTTALDTLLTPSNDLRNDNVDNNDGNRDTVESVKFT